jgi:aspartyl-tRNA synthetase
MYQTAYRTHTCGELRLTDAGQTVTLSGWMHRSRDLGGMTFIDLRDRYGITQLAFNMGIDEGLCLKARKLGREFAIRITGTVEERESKNAEMSTGNIEIKVTDLEILNASAVPPFTMEDQTDGGEDIRMKYRYLDLRRSVMTKRIEMRAKTISAVREFLDNKGFLEIETPNLIKSTPEGARDFLVPSRMQKGSFYALPQSPQILKQLLMVGGMDRYYQIVKCYRDEDFRGDRQPEFSQIDCEMAFVSQEDVLTTFEGMTAHVFKKVLDYDLPKMQRLPYKEAIEKYGSDKPDLRFEAEIHELNKYFEGTEFKVFNSVIESGGLIAGIKAKGCAGYSRKMTDQLTDFVREPHRGAGGLVWVKFNEDGTIKSSVDKFYDEAKLREIGAEFDAQPGDLLLLVSDKTDRTRKVLGDLRLEMAKREDWIDPNDWSVLWIVDFPLFEKDEETGQTIFVHHPFCAPHPEDIEHFDSDPLRCRALTYDLVMNGNEIVSGSIRINQQDLQDKVFDKLGFSEEEKQEQFGFLLNAFKYGAPPHGGCAFGLDRWVMLMSGSETIRDVIAFPKNNSGRDIMMDAPGKVSEAQMVELGIAIREKEKA